MKLVRKQMNPYLREATCMATYVELLEAAFLSSLKEIEDLKQASQSSHGTNIAPKPLVLPSKVVEQYLINFPPVSFIISEYMKLKEKDDFWFSSPFYSSNAGYKLQLKVYTKGWSHSRGTHLAIYVFVMRGEDDDCLHGLPLLC